MLVSFVFWYETLALFAWLFVLIVFTLLAVACRTGGTDAWLDWHLPLRWCDPCPSSVRDVQIAVRSRHILPEPLGRYHGSAASNHS
jgi:hypothetical protein